MGKKSRNKRNRNQEQQAQMPDQPSTPVVVSRKPEISAFWVAVIIPVICLVGAWRFPPIATPMELKSYASQIYLSGLLFIWLWISKDSKKLTLEFSQARIAFGLLFLVGTLSILWAANPDFWVYKWNKWFTGFVMFLLALQITQNEKNLDTVINLSIFGGLIVAVIGILQYLFLLNLVPQTAFPASTFGNGNMAGQVMVLTAILPMYFLCKENISKSKTWFYAVSAALLFTYAYYTRTRAVWLACTFEIFLIAIFVFFDKTKRKSWLHWSKEKTTASVFSLIAFIILINFNSSGFAPVWEIAGEQIASIAVSVGSSAAEGEHRYIIWTSTFNIFKDYPFIGTGLGNFFELYNTGGYADARILGVQRVHNDVFELGVELGSLGLLLLLGIIITMCIQLYRLILKSEGPKRILFALLAIVVTGSMMNAQISFPYQVPVPLVIMPFFVALLVRGAEDLGSQIYVVNLKSWFHKTTLALSGLVFSFILINDLLWFYDLESMNNLVRYRDSSKVWKPANPIYNQAYLTAGRSVVQAMRKLDARQLSQNITLPLVDYWPNNATNTLLAVENYLGMRDFENAEKWALQTQKSQPEGSFISELFLMEIYTQSGDYQKLQNLYESTKTLPEEVLGKTQNAYNMLHTMSINLQDFEMTTYFYDKYTEYWGEYAPLIGNQGVYYFNTGDIPNAIASMKKALTLDPNMPLAEQFRQIIAQYPDL